MMLVKPQKICDIIKLCDAGQTVGTVTTLIRWMNGKFESSSRNQFNLIERILLWKIIQQRPLQHQLVRL